MPPTFLADLLQIIVWIVTFIVIGIMAIFAPK